MKEDRTTLLVVGAVFLFVIIALWRVSAQKPNGYQGQSSGNQTGVGGWWSGLWDNAANIVDAGGRHTSSFVTSLGNTVSQIIATNKSGRYIYQNYGYSDKKTDYGPYIFGGTVIVAAVVAIALIIKK